MTLREMADLAGPAVFVPDFLECMEVLNADDFCRYALKKYVKTDKFQDDMEKCLHDYEKAIYMPFTTSSLELVRNQFTDEFTIHIVFSGWSPN